MQVLLSAVQLRAGRLVGIAAFLLVLGASSQPAAGQEGHKPAPTFTNSTPRAADEVEHVVKKGDTLWDIAREYLKDPFKWPEVFRRNSDVVENPHWIYPRETIRIPASEVKPEVLARIATKPAPPTVQRTVFSIFDGQFGGRMQSDGTAGSGGSVGVPRGEIESAPFGDRRGGPVGAGRLAASYDRSGIEASDAQRRFQLRDRVFVDLPTNVTGQAGQLLLIYRLGDELSDAAQLVIPTGILRVESQQPGQPALATVLRQFGEIRLDQFVMRPVDTRTVPGTALPVAPGSDEQVVYIANNPVLPSLQSYVVLTARSAAAVHVGDQFTLIDNSVDPRYPAPPVPAAVAEVVRVTPFAVTAIVIDQEQAKIRRGMTARLTARVP